MSHYDQSKRETKLKLNIYFLFFCVDAWSKVNEKREGAKDEDEKQRSVLVKQLYSDFVG